MKRPWNEEKKSWIFFLHDIEKSDDMVSGENDGITFFFDCETARLSIWSERLGVFTDVGISNLLNRMSNIGDEDGNSILEGTRIFYKGIELKGGCRAADTELLEFIDIKRGLGRNYININRDGFTEEGNRFFREELYPGIMEEIQKALKMVEKQAGIKEKICRIVGRKCEEARLEREDEKLATEKRHELISLVGSVAVLAYFAMRDEWNIMETLTAGKFRNTMWNTLLTEIDNILSSNDNYYLMERLKIETPLFNIKVYNEDYEEYTKRGGDRPVVGKTNFLKIFLNKNHWAILQCRISKGNPWVLHLILLGGDGQSARADMFERLTTIPKGKEDEIELEKWSEKMCFINNDSFFSIQNENQQKLLQWMLKNIPTIGLICNEQGNVRLNVLSNRIYPSIFMNKNFKYLHLERMMDKATNDRIQRFSTITWQGRENICFKELPFAVYFIKRGYLSAYSYHKTIVPINGKILGLWEQVLKSERSSQLKKCVELLLKDMDIDNYFNKIEEEQGEQYGDIKEYLKESQINVKPQLIAEFFDLIITKISQDNFKPDVDIRELLKYNKERSNKWKRIYYAVAKIYIMYGNENDDFEAGREILDENIDTEALNALCSAWLYCCIFKGEIVGAQSEIRRKYYEYLRQNKSENMAEEERIYDFIERNQQYHLDREIIKASMDEFREELIILAQELEVREINKYLDDNMRRYRFFTGQIINRYQSYTTGSD